MSCASFASPSITGMIGCSPGSRLKPAVTHQCAEASWHCQTAARADHHPASARSIALLAGRNNGRRQGIGKKIGPRPLAHQINNRLATPRYSRRPNHPAPCPSVPVRISTLMPARCRRARALGADEARGMAIIHHDQRIISVGQRADGLEIGKIAIHRKHAVGRDHDAPRASQPWLPSAAPQDHSCHYWHSDSAWPWRGGCHQ